MTKQIPSRLDNFIAAPKRAVWTLAWPMMIGFVSHALYVVVDTIFIGRLGADALAAATFVGALYFVAIALAIGFSTGVIANVAQSTGRRDKQAAERIAASSFGLGLAIGFVLLSMGLVFGQQFMPLLGANLETSELAWRYFRLICVGMPFMFLSTAIRSVLTGEGDTKTPMVVMTAANAMNLLLDPLFIFTLKMGIRGAALATVLSQVLAFGTLVYIASLKSQSFAGARISALRPRLREMLPIIRIGLPAAANQLVMSLGMLLTNRVLAVFGQAAVAGFGAGSKLDMIVALPILAIAGASMSIVGMFAGADRADLVRSTVLYAFRSVFSVAFFFGLFAYLASEIIIRAFTDDPRALAVGSTYLAYMVFAYPLMAGGITSGRLLQGLGYGIPPLIITVTRVLVISIPGAYVAVYLFDAPIRSIWLAVIAGGIVSNLMAMHWIRKFVWKCDPTAEARK